MKQIRVLIVDDSPTIRALIGGALSKHADIAVVGEAGDPYEAREAIKTLNPDVLTLDVEMPRMSGLEFLEKIMRLRPMPVIMVSTLTQAGAAATIEALEKGAFDCVGKPSFDDLADKIRAAATSRPRAFSAPARAESAPRAYQPSEKVLAIGASTGGVEALLTMLSAFPANCPPTLITQHMPAAFTASFAARLDRMSAPRVEEATDDAPVETGRVYLAPGGVAHLTVTGASALRCRLVASDAVNGHRPSVDVMFDSVARVCGARGVWGHSYRHGPRRRPRPARDAPSGRTHARPRCGFVGRLRHAAVGIRNRRG